jgi:hypothetical protein
MSKSQNRASVQDLPGPLARPLVYSVKHGQLRMPSDLHLFNHYLDSVETGILKPSPSLKESAVASKPTAPKMPRSQVALPCAGETAQSRKRTAIKLFESLQRKRPARGDGAKDHRFPDIGRVEADLRRENKALEGVSGLFSGEYDEDANDTGAAATTETPAAPGHRSARTTPTRTSSTPNQNYPNKPKGDAPIPEEPSTEGPPIIDRIQTAIPSEPGKSTSDEEPSNSTTETKSDVEEAPAKCASMASGVVQPPKPANEKQVKKQRAKKTQSEKKQAEKKQAEKKQPRYITDTKRMRGPFGNPSTCLTESTRKFQCKEWHRDEGPQDEGGSISLQVGHFIVTMAPGMGNARFQVYDFRREGIVIDWREMGSSIIPKSAIDRGCYARVGDEDGKQKLYKIKSSKHLWVRRNPALTVALVEAGVAMFEAEASSQRGAGTIEILGSGDSDKFPWCRLQELLTPRSQLEPFFDDILREGVINAQTTNVACFVCNMPVTVPLNYSKDYAFKSWDTVDKAWKGKYDKFRSHCEEHHSDQPLWSLDIRDNTFRADQRFEVRDRVQWSMVQAIENESIPLKRFICCLEGDSFPLRYKLGQLFACAQSTNLNSDTLRKTAPHVKLMKERKERATVTGKGADDAEKLFQPFRMEVTRYLTSIEDSFLRFDFGRLADALATAGDAIGTPEPIVAPPQNNKAGEAKRKALLLWNVTHLFFYRGAYMDPPFLPLLTKIPDTARCTVEDLIRQSKRNTEQ